MTQMRRNKTWLLPVLFGVLVSLSVVWGYQLEKFDHIEPLNLVYSALFLVLSAIISFLVKTSWVFLAKKEGVYEDKELQPGYDKKTFAFVWAFIAACNLIVLLGVYPGFFVYDAQTEVIEVLSRQFTTHHPLLHVLMLGGSVAFFNKFFGNVNAGIFAYIFSQMLIMTGIFTYYLSFMKIHGAGKRIRKIVAVFFAVFPTIVMYTLCSCKDGFFSSLLVLAVLLFVRLLEEKDERKAKGIFWEIVVSGTLMMLFRHNGFYAWTVFAVLMLIIMALSKKKADDKYASKRKLKAFALVIPVVAYLCMNMVLTAVFVTDKGTKEHQEMLTVPIQQLGRVYAYDKSSMAPEDIETLERYLSPEGLSHYTPRCSDILKMYFDNAEYEADKASFLRLWVKTGLSHPMSYLNSWFLTSYGYWYPFSVINVYQGNTVFTFTYTDSSYFGYEVEEPGYRQSLIPFIDSFYRKLSIEKFQQNIPVISLLFAPAAYFWICIYLFLTAIVLGRDKEKLMPFMLILMVWLTVLLGPTYLVRYVIYLWYIVPVLFCITFCKD
ncbi:MAG: DUF6020 family protein [Butyrivibrio sp.]|nr:DUF6020 family protein [Butyrivibrio sp.]